MLKRDEETLPIHTMLRFRMIQVLSSFLITTPSALLLTLKILLISDEMYAAIDDPNNQAVYTSGSETYAQIQPHVAPLTIAVEINTTPGSMQQNGESPAQPTTPPMPTPMPVPVSHSSYTAANGTTISTVSSPRHSVIINAYMEDQPVLPPVEILKTAHSRQGNAMHIQFLLNSFCNNQ